MFHLFVALLTIVFSTLAPNTAAAQKRSPIAKDSVWEVQRLGSLSKDISLIGPHKKPGKVILVTQHQTTVFDEKTSRMVGAYKRNAGIYDDTTLKEIQNLGPDDGLHAISRDGKKRLWTKRRGFDVMKNRLTSTVLEGFRASTGAVAFHPNKELIAVNVRERDPKEDGMCLIGLSNIRIFTMDGMLVRQFPDTAGGGAWLDFSPNGKTLAVASPNTSDTQLVDYLTGKVLQKFPTQAYSPPGKFHPAGKMIALFGSNCCQIWNTESGKLIQKIEITTRKDMGGIVWSQKGDMLIVASQGKLSFFDSDSWEKIRELKLFHGGVSELMITPDGSRIIAETKSLEKWNLDARMVEAWGIKS